MQRCSGVSKVNILTLKQNTWRCKTPIYINTSNAFNFQFNLPPRQKEENFGFWLLSFPRFPRDKHLRPTACPPRWTSSLLNGQPSHESAGFLFVLLRSYIPCTWMALIWDVRSWCESLSWSFGWQQKDKDHTCMDGLSSGYSWSESRCYPSDLIYTCKLCNDILVLLHHIL